MIEHMDEESWHWLLSARERTNQTFICSLLTRRADIIIRNIILALSISRLFLHQSKTQYPEEDWIALLAAPMPAKKQLIKYAYQRKRCLVRPGCSIFTVSGRRQMVIGLCGGILLILPGYGCTKVSERIIGCASSRNICAGRRLNCWQLVDIRHQPGAPGYRDVVSLRDNNGFEVVLMANKADKLSKISKSAS